jgi:hypothetical protein
MANVRVYDLSVSDSDPNVKLVKVKYKLLLGLKAQLMRGDRTHSDCWNITLKVIDEITEYIDRLPNWRPGR